MASSGPTLSPTQLEIFLDGCGHPLQGEPAGLEGKGPPQLLFLVDIQRTRSGWPAALITLLPLVPGKTLPQIAHFQLCSAVCPALPTSLTEANLGCTDLFIYTPKANETQAQELETKPSSQGWLVCQGKGVTGQLSRWLLSHLHLCKQHRAAVLHSDLRSGDTE